MGLKNRADCNAAFHRLEELLDRDPDTGTPEAEELQLLASLLDDYESKEFPIKKPHRADAIRFRMEQQNKTRPRIRERIIRRVLNALLSWLFRRWRKTVVDDDTPDIFRDLKDRRRHTEVGSRRE